MVLVIPLIIVFVAVFLILRTSKRQKIMQDLPPGPPGLPILGNFLQIVKDPHLKLSQWAREYGKLFTIRVGTKNALVVSDPKMLKEIFSHPASTGKFKTDTFLLLSRGPYGLISTEGDTWTEQRQFCMRSLIGYGFGSKTSLEPLILSEAQEVVEWIKEETRKCGAVSLAEILKIATNNTLWTIVSGQRISLRDQTVSKLTNDFMRAMQNSIKTGLGYLPWLKYIAPEASGYNQLDRCTKDLHAFIQEYFDEHRKTHTPGAPRDLIDSYLDMMDQTTNPRSSFHGVIGAKNSVSSVVEIFEAGSETTSMTLNWLILYLSHHQNAQAKLHAEIDSVIGRCREPSFSDKPNMPYTEAVIQEVLRKSSLVPLGTIHELLDDVQMYGYQLPKGLLLIPNMYHIHHDQEIWGDPEYFRPERFLIEEDSRLKVIKSEALVPFQPGKRQCLGEPLAKDVLFLFVTKLFQTFHFHPDPENPKPNFEPDVGIALFTQPFKVKMTVR